MRKLTEEERKHSKKRQKEYFRQYLKTPLGRAHNLLCTYKIEDRKRNRGECTLTAQWIVDNIFSKPCVHCGESDWRKIGCNRLDNSKPHTEDNVEPCCWECNNKLGCDERKKKVYQYTLDGRLVKVWDSIKEIMDDGTFNAIHVNTCCKGGRLDKRDNKWYVCYQHKGFKWSYEPIDDFSEIIQGMNKKKKLSEESKQKIADKHSKEIYQYTLEGELIAVYKNSVEASKATNLGQACISQAAVGKFYSNKRKKWYYKNTYMGYRWSHTPL